MVQSGGQPDAVIDAAFDTFGWKGTRKGYVTKLTMMTNVRRAQALGCDGAEGMENMRRGQSPIVRRGEYFGDKMSVDPILPRAELTDLDNVLANLELMPMRMNSNKSAKLGPRQKEAARLFVWAGILEAAEVPWAASFANRPAASDTAPQPVVRAPAAPARPAKFGGSTRSPVSHRMDCRAIDSIVEDNLVAYGSRDEAIRAGKRPCPKGNP